MTGFRSRLVRNTNSSPNSDFDRLDREHLHNYPQEENPLTNEDFRTLICADLEFEYRIAQSRQLALFRRNPSTWEFLLLLAMQDGESTDGMYGTIDNITTKYIGMSAMLKFMRDRRDDGSLEFREHHKRSKWRIKLSDQLDTQLRNVLMQRQREFEHLLNSPAQTQKID